MTDVFSNVRNFTANPDLLIVRLDWDDKMIEQLKEQNAELKILVAEVNVDHNAVNNKLDEQADYLNSFADSIAEHRAQVTPATPTDVDPDNPTV
jgi:hypothetical protein